MNKVELERRKELLRERKDKEGKPLGWTKPSNRDARRICLERARLRRYRYDGSIKAE